MPPALFVWLVPSIVALWAAWAVPKHRLFNNDGLSPQQRTTNAAAANGNREYAIYVIGDLHGDVDCAQHWIDRTGLVGVDKNSRVSSWRDPSSHLVLVGDYVDKGPRSRQTVELVKGLTEDFPQHVTALLGNHEMELLLDRDATRWNVWGGAGYFALAYASVHPGEYLNYIGREPDEKDNIVVEALYNASLEVYGRGAHQRVLMAPVERVGGRSILHYVPQSLRPLVQERLEEYQEAYLNSFRSGTELGSWLERRPIIAQLNETVFVHGGISTRAAKLIAEDGIEGINQLFAENANDKSLNYFIEQTEKGQVIYDLVTFRGNHQDGACPYLPRLLPKGASKLGVGHTPDWSVRLLCEGNFLALDSSLGRWFRNSGNEYCPGHQRRLSSNGRYVCEEITQQCQGQIVKIKGGHVELIE